MPFTPSIQQADVFDWVQNGHGSARLIAVAGAGKTTTIIEATRYMTGSVFVGAYNKKIADELTARVNQLGIGSRVRASTFHSAGNTAWSRACSKRPLVEGHKTRKIMDDLGINDVLKEFVEKGVSIAKQTGFGIFNSIDDQTSWEEVIEHFDLLDSLQKDSYGRMPTTGEAIGACVSVLNESIKRDKVMIDFDDMIFSPLYHGVKFFENDWVLVDEAQDTNPVRRLLARKMLKTSGRLLAVGDPHQAIYGFTGADNDALDLIKKEFGCIDLPLTVTFRCPKSVVALAKTWVDHIESHPDSKDGSVTTIHLDQFNKLPATELTRDDVVLCRYTKPLVQEAYKLIRRGIGCHVEGKDIGKGLLALCAKWSVDSCSQLTRKLESYVVTETEKLMRKGKETMAEALQDRVETLYVIMENLGEEATVNELRAAIDKLFGDVPAGCTSFNLTLSTIHKAKGREWDRVYLLGRNSYQPSKYARQQWQKDQEVNLMYVAVTRSKNLLVEVAV